MAKTDKRIYYTIGEVAEMFDVSPTLIRFWEQKFDILKPHRNKKGNRLFTPEDLENLKLIYHLVKENGMTLAGARKRLKENKSGISHDMEVLEHLYSIKAVLAEMRQALKVGTDDFAAEDEVTTEPAGPRITEDMATAFGAPEKEQEEAQETPLSEDYTDNSAANGDAVNSGINEYTEEIDTDIEEQAGVDMPVVPPEERTPLAGVSDNEMIFWVGLFDDTPAAGKAESIIGEQNIDPEYISLIAEEIAIAGEVAEAIAEIEGAPDSGAKPLIVEQTLF